MISRFIATAAVALSLLAASGFAQTAAQLLQKGIYTQQTAGDVDAAVRIYRQVIASAGSQRGLAAQAQMQIVGALMQKGDPDAANLEYRILATDYRDQKEVLASAVAQNMDGRITRAARAVGPPLLRQGTLEGGVYRHTLTGMEITLPPGWTVTHDGLYSGGGEMVYLGNPDPYLTAFLWLMPDSEAAADIPRLLEGDLDYRVKERTIWGLAGYRVRPETVKPWLPGGRQALSAVAEFDANGVKMIEYLTFVRSEKTQIFIWGTVPAAYVMQCQAYFDRVTSAIRLP